MFRTLTRMQQIADLLIAGGYVLLFVLVPAVGLNASLPDVLVALVLGGALALRRLSPPLALIAAWAGAVLQMSLSPSNAPSVLDAAIPPVVYACAAYGTRAIRWAAFASSLLGGAIAGTFVMRYEFQTALTSGLGATADLLRGFFTVSLLTAVTLLLAWTIGMLVATGRRSRANRLEALQASRTAATEQERTRIARDMHDVVAHSLAVVIAQSDGARLLRRTDPEAVDEALEVIGSTARAALADVRVLLQQLRYEGTTSVQPGLADLDALVARFRASGLDVTLERSRAVEESGTPVQLAAFRIVQESLTNALRHGDTTVPARVVLARTPHGIEVEVTNGTTAGRPAKEGPMGHGIVGMTERAATVQGRLTAAPEGDRFVVRAFLPVASRAEALA